MCHRTGTKRKKIALSGVGFLLDLWYKGYFQRDLKENNNAKSM